MKHFLSFIIFAFALDLQGSLFQADIRVAYYRPDSATVRGIYGDGWPEYQFELSRELLQGVSIWASVSGFSKNGYSIGGGDPTSLQLIPIGLGLKHQIPLNCNLSLNLGAGGTYSFLKIHNDSPFVEQYVRNEAFGAILKSSLSYTLCNQFVISIFADYQFQRFCFEQDEDSVVERNNLNLNSLKTGAGVGIRF